MSRRNEIDVFRIDREIEKHERRIQDERTYLALLEDQLGLLKAKRQLLVDQDQPDSSNRPQEELL